MTTTPATLPATVATEQPDQLLPRVQLSMLWLAVLLSMVFRDIHEMGTPEFLELVATIDVPEWLFLIAGIVLTLPIVLIPANVLGARRWLRPTNITIAVLMVLSFAGNPPGDLDDWWFFAVELVLLAVIVRRSWAWTETPAA